MAGGLLWRVRRPPISAVGRRSGSGVAARWRRLVEAGLCGVRPPAAAPSKVGHGEPAVACQPIFTPEMTEAAGYEASGMIISMRQQHVLSAIIFLFVARPSRSRAAIVRSPSRHRHARLLVAATGSTACIIEDACSCVARAIILYDAHKMHVNAIDTRIGS